MTIAKDQFLSWPMISAQQSNSVETMTGAARYSFFQARNGLYHSLGLLGIERGSHVLAPSYICRAAIDPLVAYGVDVGFYPVSRECSIDLRELEKRITPKTEAIIIVHYFGFPQSLGPLRRLCDQYHLALIEDCAHVLSGEFEGKPIGTLGDAAVFSWRKFLPVYDGAELVINRPGQHAAVKLTRESGLFTLKVAGNILDASLARTHQPLLKLAYWGIRAGQVTFRKGLNGYLQKSPMMQVETNTVDFDLQTINWPMSRLSRWTRSHSNIRNIIARRRRNYTTLLEHFSASSRVKPLFAYLPATVCPWVFPVFFPDLNDAHMALRHRGIPAVTWSGVRHPEIEPRIFTDSAFLYENLVFLPVHQCLGDQDMVNIAEACVNL